MKIAVDFESTQGQRTGIGSFAANLFAAIQKEQSGLEFIFYEKKSSRAGLNSLGRITWESVEIPMRVLKDRPRVVYSPGFSPAYRCAARRVVTVHDLIGLAYPANQKSFSYLYWSRWLPFTLKRAHRLIASSESTRRDIRRFLKISEAQVPLVPLACSKLFIKRDEKKRPGEVCLKYNLTGPFMISVGTLEPRKNLIKLLEAYARLKKRGKNGFSLLIVGKPGAAEDRLRAFISENHLDGSVKIAGYASEEDLACLYNAAMGYVNVSLYEGFGLSVLEAMSCGLSGVVSNRSSLPEVSGDTAISVNPENTDEIAEALWNFTSDGRLRQSLSEAAYLRSKAFSAEKMARAMINIFKKEAA